MNLLQSVFYLSEALHTHMCVHVNESVCVDVWVPAQEMEGSDDKSRILGTVITKNKAMGHSTKDQQDELNKPLSN